jgi:DnaK suppressor protein
VTPQQQKDFLQQLRDTRAELVQIEETLKASGKTVELDQTRVGRLSRMDAMQGQQMALQASRRREQQLRLIAAAEKRIEDDEYGYCLECGEAIAIGRLQADPTHSECIDCAA